MIGPSDVADLIIEHLKKCGYSSLDFEDDDYYDWEAMYNVLVNEVHLEKN